MPYSSIYNQPSVYYIYSVCNTVNGRNYIGSTINIKSRLSGHISSLKKGVHPCKELQSDFNKQNQIGFDTKIISKHKYNGNEGQFKMEDRAIKKEINPYNAFLNHRRKGQKRTFIKRIDTIEVIRCVIKL